MALISDLKTPVNLNDQANGATRVNNTMQSFPLFETGMPKGNLLNVINFLGVELPAHLRYTPTANETFCNIYAYDVCYLMNKFIPRVWWNNKAINLINTGAPQPVTYAVTVNEIVANDLFTWFKQYGGNFGWTNIGDVDTLQNNINTTNSFGIIVAKNSIGHGHITVVVPEGISAIKAVRDPGGTVINPLQSQAGSHNFEFGSLGGNSPWWLPANYTAKFYC